MATINGIQKVASANNVAKKAATGLGVMIGSKSVQERFNKMLGDESAGFLSSLLSLVNNNKLLQTAAPASVLAAAATAAALKLPINPTLGKAWIVPYKGAAQFQIGYKGIIELAMRSKQMKSIIMLPVYEGQILNWDPFTETYERGEQLSDNVVGYWAHFETKFGFSKSTYWTKEEVTAHAKRFSKSFNNGPWKTDFDAMACKTVLLSILKTYAPLSIDAQNALEKDGKAVTVDEKTGQEEYVDAEIIDAENGSYEAVEVAAENEATTSDGRKVDTDTGELFAE